MAKKTYPQLHMHVSEHLKKQVKKRAKALELTITKYVKRCIEKDLNSV